MDEDEEEEEEDEHEDEEEEEQEEDDDDDEDEEDEEDDEEEGSDPDPVIHQADFYRYVLMPCLDAHDRYIAAKQTPEPASSTKARKPPAMISTNYLVAVLLGAIRPPPRSV